VLIAVVDDLAPSMKHPLKAPVGLANVVKPGCERQITAKLYRKSKPLRVGTRALLDIPDMNIEADFGTCVGGARRLRSPVHLPL
jgi:hypothetical protein